MGSLTFAFRTAFQNSLRHRRAILSLALGIGATAGIFSVFHQVLLQPLAVPVNLSAPGPKPGFGSCGRAGDCEVVFSDAMFRDLQKIRTVFTDIAADVGFAAHVGYGPQTSSGEGLLVSGSYFLVLEQTALGRLLNSNDDRVVGEPPGVVLSYNYSSSRFGPDPTVLNKQLIVNGQPHIVGVAPNGFDGTTIGMRLPFRRRARRRKRGAVDVVPDDRR
jgi:putative ABC transport system permease protein